MPESRRLRWIAVSILFISSALNYLDRTVLSALMPTIREEFSIGGAGLGALIAAFSITYALAAPLMGHLIDRFGLRYGASFVVGFWSLVTIATGSAGGFLSLMAFRALLGLAESGAIPCTGKGSAAYLEPRDRALGSAVSQIGITVGLSSAPILTEIVTARFGWRASFVVAGLLGFIWIPIWLWISKRIPAGEIPGDPPRVPYREMLRDRRFLALIVSNGLAMTVYSLWTIWLTQFFVDTFHLTQLQANKGYAWIPPIFATFGGLSGGFLAQRIIREGVDSVTARVRISLFASVFVFATALAPLVGSPALSVVCISVSCFALLMMSVNYYSIPLDLFGAGRAAFATSFLVSVYGLMNAVLSPVIGRWSDTSGWAPVCVVLSVLPLLSVLLLRSAMKRSGTPVVVSFCSGPPELASRMIDEVRSLVPEYEHVAVSRDPVEGVRTVAPEELGRLRIGLAPTLFFTGPEYDDIRRLAFRYAPFKVLAYNTALERHHLKLTTPVATILFLQKVALDRIWLRPKWWPFRRERSTWPDTHVVFDGRPLTAGRRRVAVLSPYYPWPLSHGGAVRIYNLLREASKEFDIWLFSFAEDPRMTAAGSPVLDFCAQVVLFPNPRYREPRWASLDPPEVGEFTTTYVGNVIADFARRHGIELLQTEYTQLARYGGDILVEHDVTFDLYEQITKQTQSLSATWNWWRWKRFETNAVRNFPRVVVMSDRDVALLPAARSVVLPNGVDLVRFQPAPQVSAPHLLFVGSFAHFPNVVAFRWLLERVLPLLPPDFRVTVISGRNPELYWNEPIRDERVELHGFIADVRPFYAAASIVVVPTQVSAGTNLKVIEAMAMERAIVSTTSGVNGLGITNQAIVADSPEEFAGAILHLQNEANFRHELAARGRRYAEERFGWERIGVGQRRLWRELLAERAGIQIRPGTREDADAIGQIQVASHGASQWEPDTYFTFDVRVALQNEAISGFLVSRPIGPGELEILNIAVAPEARRRGIATALIESLDAPVVFLEVRESNTPAQRLYKQLGFQTVGRRENYYDDPPEAALVMRRTTSYFGT